MARRETIYNNEYYHVYNRGVDKRAIFLDKQDYHYFMKLLYLGNSDISIDMMRMGNNRDFFAIERPGKKVEVAAWCLMPNHFHILLRQTRENGITEYMQKICTGLALYFNRKYDRSGALLQGRYKSKHVDSEEYLRYLVAYIHLNPIDLIDPAWEEDGIESFEKAKLHLDTYTYSSFMDYLQRERPQRCILDKESVASDMTDPSKLYKLIQKV